MSFLAVLETVGEELQALSRQGNGFANGICAQNDMREGLYIKINEKGIIMNRQSNEKGSADLPQREHADGGVQNRSLLTGPRFLLVTWILLLLLGAFFLFASLSDLLADARSGLPSDHLAAFSAIAGMSWSAAQHSSPGITQFITRLEIAYAVHELVFGLLFLIIVAIPFRRLARWAWWTCWVPMLANLTYTFTIAHYSTTTLTYSLIADVALPVLLLLQIPAFFGKSSQVKKPI